MRAHRRGGRLHGRRRGRGGRRDPADGARAGAGPNGPERVNRIDRAPVGSARAFADHLRLVWLTPAMDPLLSGPASERRKFLDRLVLAIDPGHGARVGQFERALRGRNRLLEEGGRDTAWLDAVEREAAELGVAIAAARARMRRPARGADSAPERDDDSAVSLGRAGAARRGRDDSSPRGRRWRRRTATAATAARQPRPRRGGRAHADRPACRRSRRDATGRRARRPRAPRPASRRRCWSASCSPMRGWWRTCRGIAPIALLDEIAAHFDPRRREALFAALAAVGGQAFLTGADPAAFADVRRRAQYPRWPRAGRARARQACPASDDRCAARAPMRPSA